MMWTSDLADEKRKCLFKESIEHQKENQEFLSRNIVETNVPDCLLNENQH